VKLGVFGLNVSSAGALSLSPKRHEIDWDQNVRLVRLAEEAGFEAAVPYARWRGFEGASNPWGQSFEPYCWAAGLAAQTSRITIFTTSHCLTVSPVMAAKEIATVDHISHGRVCLNVAAGWFEKELRMFGAHALDHDERYAYAEEWLEVVLGLWTRQEEIDHRGRWLAVENGYLQPKPIQAPRPPVMNAAFSPRGHQFAAQYADIAFVSAFDPAGAGRKAVDIRGRAADLGRELQVWMAAAVICAEDERMAANLVNEYQRFADDSAIRNCIDWTMGGTRMPDEQRQQLARSMATTFGSYPLIGSPQRMPHLDELRRGIAAVHFRGHAPARTRRSAKPPWLRTLLQPPSRGRVS
jgi:alkanesulfonate monooxygenase SsuD/methylene tetrahydromethanopterin reductase-like flavin-dependent oxidoreductase (luciferase family)